MENKKDNVYNFELKSDDERVYFANTIESKKDIEAINEMLRIYVEPSIKKAQKTTKPKKASGLNSGFKKSAKIDKK